MYSSVVEHLSTCLACMKCWVLPQEPHTYTHTTIPTESLDLCEVCSGMHSDTLITMTISLPFLSLSTLYLPHPFLFFFFFFFLPHRCPHKSKAFSFCSGEGLRDGCSLKSFVDLGRPSLVSRTSTAHRRLERNSGSS